MKVATKLNRYLSCAPTAPCWHYDAGDTAMCAARGAAKNKFPVSCQVAAISVPTDDSVYRFPPDQNKDVCDWCVFTENGHRGFFLELKGSDFEHALSQLKSTMSYMQAQYAVEPRRAIAVLSGAHPSNSRPGKANAKVKFKSAFPHVILCERSSGRAKPDDVLQ